MSGRKRQARMPVLLLQRLTRRPDPRGEMKKVKRLLPRSRVEPGDTWDLYVGKDNRVEYLVFHHGGDKKPSLVSATWTGYKKAGPLLISTEHRGTADGKPLHIFISGVAVKVTGSDKWIDAK